ncbi:hypothetical protein HY490_04555, partial [Candidatus Woesearchaeota archaeon]|nr:hypothetical protein [Candidatus Woesearchaeota archaeon]
FKLSVPSGFHTLCLVDPVEPGQLQAKHPLLFNAWRAGSENIFLLPISKQPFPLFIKDIEVFGPEGRGFLCFENIQGSVTMQLEGLGDKAKVTVAERAQ